MFEDLNASPPLEQQAMSSEPDLIARREAVARIIDADAFGPLYHASINYQKRRQREALAKADAIIALEASDADTVRVPREVLQAVTDMAHAFESHWPSRKASGYIAAAYYALDAAAHPKPEPVETQP